MQEPVESTATIERDARAIAAHCRQVLTHAGLVNATIERLMTYVSRHLPITGQEEGSAFIPPLYAVRIGRALRLDDAVVVQFAAAGCFFFAAADLADDCADGDIRQSVGIDINDTCCLLFAQRQCVSALPVPGDVRGRLAQLFAEAGFEMTIGQEADLRGTNAILADAPLNIALGKSGGELSAFFAGPAILADLDPGPWRDYGRALGALAQVLTDYLDLFLNPDSDDWDTAKPTVPIRRGLDSSVYGEKVRLLLAGARADSARKAAGVWQLTQAGAAPALAEVTGSLASRMEAAEALLQNPPVLADCRTTLLEWCAGVQEALEEFEGDPEPTGEEPETQRVAAVQAGRAFLEADPRLDEVVVRIRKPLFEGRFDFTQRAVTIGLLRGLGLSVQAACRSVFGRLDGCGGRQVDMPIYEDWETWGAVSQCAQTRRQVRHPFVRAGIRRLDALLAADRLDAAFGGLATPADLVALSHCVVGLSRPVFASARQVREAVLSLFLRHWDRHRSDDDWSFCEEFLVWRALVAAAPAQAEANAEALVAASQARLSLSGGMGGVLETAQRTIIIHAVGARLSAGPQIARFLVDAQHLDGGYEPGRLTRRFTATQHPGSRRLTTAFVLEALRVLSQPL